MQPRGSTWRGTVGGTAALGLLLTCALTSFADPPRKNEPPQPLPKELVAAWKAAGAQVGWMRADKAGYIGFLPEKQGVADDLPAFRFGTWKEGLVANLPSPAAAFGLFLGGTQVTDAGLKEIARL